MIYSYLKKQAGTLQTAIRYGVPVLAALGGTAFGVKAGGDRRQRKIEEELTNLIRQYQSPRR